MQENEVLGKKTDPKKTTTLGYHNTRKMGEKVFIVTVVDYIQEHNNGNENH